MRFGAFAVLAVVGPGVAFQRLLRLRVDPALVLPLGLAACSGACWLAAVTGLSWLGPAAGLAGGPPKPCAGAGLEALRSMMTLAPFEPGGWPEMKSRMRFAVSIVMRPPNRSRLTSLPSFTARRPKVDSAMRVARQ